MQINPEGARPRSRSFTANARRNQIVLAAVETIAELGCAQASFARIAERAGLSSTRLISYHFEGRDELIRQVDAHVYGAIGAFMDRRTGTPATASEALEAFIRGNIEFIAAHRTQMKALLNIFLSGELDYGAEADSAAISPVERILAWGQQSGEFRDFDTRVLGEVVQRSIDGLPFLLESHPDIDPAAYADELVAAFTPAVRSVRPGERP